MTKLPDELAVLPQQLVATYPDALTEAEYGDLLIRAFAAGWQAGAGAMKEMMRIKGDAQNNWVVDRIPLPVPE